MDTPLLSTTRWCTLRQPASQALIAQRVLTVFDAKGARVYSRKLTAAQTYELIKVNMTPASAGTYFCRTRDASGVRLASGKVVVQNQHTYQFYWRYIKLRLISGSFIT